MPYVIKEEGKSFKPAPEGLHQAVCCDVVDLGEMPNQFKPGTTQAKVRLVWQIEETDPENDNKRYLVSRMYTASLNEKATLRHHLESWRGRKLTGEELKGFDVEVLLGVNCQLNVVQNQKDDGKVYANVETIVPLGKGMQKLVVDENYVRVKDRDPNAVSTSDAVDDDVPF